MLRVYNSVKAERFDEVIDTFPSLSIAVVGDFFLDKYLDIDPCLSEISVETGRVAYQVTQVRHSPGAAGTVVNNLAALGAGTLHAVGFTGDDGESYDLRRDLESIGCSTARLHVDGTRRTPTYLKPRDATVPGLEGEHSRYDTKNRNATAPGLMSRIIRSLEEAVREVDAVIVMDQVEEPGCGVVCPPVADAVSSLASAHPGVVFWADSRRRIRSFRNIITKPNQFEALGIAFPRPGENVGVAQLERALPELRSLTGAPVFVTRGPEGMIVSDPVPTVVPTVELQGPIDPTGAGDSATAGCVLALAAGADYGLAALIGNLTASVTVQQLAVTGTSSPGQLKDRLRLWLTQRRQEAS